MIWINTSFRINKAAILASKINFQKSLIRKSKQLIYNCQAHSYSRRRASDKLHLTNIGLIAWTSIVWINAHRISMESSVINPNHLTGLKPRFQEPQEGSASEETALELPQWLDHQTYQQPKATSPSSRSKETTLICVYQKIPIKSLRWTIPWEQSNRISFVPLKILSKYWHQFLKMSSRAKQKVMKETFTKIAGKLSQPAKKH